MSIISVSAAIGLLQVLLLAKFAPNLHHLTQQDLVAQANEQGPLVEVLTGITTTKAAGSEKWAAARWSGLFKPIAPDGTAAQLKRSAAG